MRIHHLNCGSFCPHGRRLINGEGGLLERGSVICHCLAIETDGGIVLVDTGFGLADARDPRRLPAIFRAAMEPRPLVETTAIEQLRGLGLDPADVSHIVTTHLDLDHAGGLPDFPDAEVHLLEAELAAATHPRLNERTRYARAQWVHGPNWVTHAAGGDEWLGFESVRILPETDTGLVLVPLVGHSRGHTGVAIDTGDGWLLHCGDAYFHHGEIQTPPSCPPMLSFFQNLTAADNRARRRNRARLRELATRHGDEVELICAHDPWHLDRVRAEAGAGAAPA
jgi:glyoxylase-like metal-dependent hydrolase (beta-lactamase superfamily II)